MVLIERSVPEKAAGWQAGSPLLEIARVLVRFDHVASFIVNVDHGVMRSAALAGVADCIAGSVRSVMPQPTEWQRIGNQIDAAMIFARADFVAVACIDIGERISGFVQDAINCLTNSVNFYRGVQWREPSQPNQYVGRGVASPTRKSRSGVGRQY